MADGKKYNGETWEHSLFKRGTETGNVENLIYANGQPLINWEISGNTIGNVGVGDKTKNLLPIAGLGSRRIGGVDFIDNGDGAITVSGVCTDRYSQLSISIPPDISGNVIISGCPDGGDTAKYDIYCWDTDANARPKNWQGQSSLSDFGNGSEVTFVAGHDNRIVIRTYGDYAKNGLNFEPMIRLPNESSGFEPYGYKIPVFCGGTTTNVYLPDPLLAGESITMTDTGIQIPTIDGANMVFIGTEVQPSEFTATWTGWHNAVCKEWDGSQWE